MDHFGRIRMKYQLRVIIDLSRCTNKIAMIFYYLQLRWKTEYNLRANGMKWIKRLYSRFMCECDWIQYGIPMSFQIIIIIQSHNQLLWVEVKLREILSPFYPKAVFRYKYCNHRQIVNFACKRWNWRWERCYRTLCTCQLNIAVSLVAVILYEFFWEAGPESAPEVLIQKPVLASYKYRTRNKCGVCKTKSSTGFGHINAAIRRFPFITLRVSR